MYKKILVIALFVVSVPLSMWAQQDTFLGTWKMNIAKSKFDPGPPPKSPTIVKREGAPSGGVKTTVDGVDAQGKPTRTEYTAAYDGKDYPVKGSPSYDSVSLRRIDPNTRLLVNKKVGSVVRMIRQVVSSDGKTLTNVELGVAAQGHSFFYMTVYNKQ